MSARLRESNQRADRPITVLSRQNGEKTTRPCNLHPIHYPGFCSWDNLASDVVGLTAVEWLHGLPANDRCDGVGTGYGDAGVGGTGARCEPAAEGHPRLERLMHPCSVYELAGSGNPCGLSEPECAWWQRAPGTCVSVRDTDHVSRGGKRDVCENSMAGGRDCGFRSSGRSGSDPCELRIESESVSLRRCLSGRRVDQRNGRLRGQPVRELVDDQDDQFLGRKRVFGKRNGRSENRPGERRRQSLESRRCFQANRSSQRSRERHLLLHGPEHRRLVRLTSARHQPKSDVQEPTRYSRPSFPSGAGTRRRACLGPDR